MDILTKEFAHNVSNLLKIVLFSRPKSSGDEIYKKTLEIQTKYFTAFKSELNDENISFLRRNIKKFNLIFKMNNNAPIDISGDQTVIQQNILNYKVCSGMENGDINDMMRYFMKYPLVIFDYLKLEYVMAQGPYQEIIWKQLQMIFCQTQLILSTQSGRDTEEKKVLKSRLHQHNQERLMFLQESLENDQTYKDITAKMEADKKFSKKTAPKMNADKIKAAKDEVISKFSGKGIKNSDPIFKLVDKITEKLDNFDDSNPSDIVQQIMSIAEDVSSDMKGEVSTNQGDYIESVAAVKDIFTEALNKSDGEVPQDFKNIANFFFASNGQGQTSDQNLINMIEQLIATNGLDRSDFYKSVVNEMGQIDVSLMKKYLDERGIFLPGDNPGDNRDPVRDKLEEIITSNGYDRDHFYHHVLDSDGKLDMNKMKEYMNVTPRT